MQKSKRRELGRAVGLVAGYLVFFWAVRLVFLTLVAYAFARTPDQMAGSLQKIADMARANQLLVCGFSALLYIALLQILHPLTRTRFAEVFDSAELKTCFAPNALNGLILTAVLVAGTTLGGHMAFLGVYMKFDEVVASVASAAVFGTALSIMVVVEEFILRAGLEPRLSRRFGVAGAAAGSSAAYLLLKFSQFELTWLAALNMVLLNLTLSMIARAGRSFMASAAFAATFLAILHVVLGLPLLGQDMPGLFLLRADSDEGLGSLLSGGTGGPETGLVLTVLLVIYLYLPQIRSKKIEV